MKLIQPGITRRSVLGLSLTFASWMVSAQGYPTRPITLVSPFLAGTSADNTARLISEIASKELGQPIIMENKPGADGLIAINDVLKSPPDGYRLLWAGGASLMGIPAMRKIPPYDPLKDFTPIAGSVDFTLFLYTHPTFPAKTMKQFIDYVKANPGKVAYATGNPQSRMTMGDIIKRYGLDMVHVQYKGEVAIGTDLITNRVQVMFGTTTQLPMAKAGKLNVISTTLPRRSPIMPDLPTMREEGIAGAEFGGGWVSLLGPAGMDPTVVARVHRAYTKALEGKQVQATLQETGQLYSPRGSGKELSEFMRSQRDSYHRTVTDLNMVQE